MGGASSRLTVVATGALLLAALPPVGALADDGWTPTVATTNVNVVPNVVPKVVPNVSKGTMPRGPTGYGKLEHALAGLPPMPEAKPLNIKKPAPMAKVAPVVPPPVQPQPPLPQPVAAAPSTDIVTGSIDAIESTRMLSPADKERLIAEDAPPGALITGTVDTPNSDLARGYCVNIAGAAADARIALQRAKLAEAEHEISKRIATLEAKSAEYKSWVDRREEFLKRAATSLVKIYTAMEPDAAALQLVAMDEETAASVLMKLEPANASAILNEMAPEKAARLAAGIVGAARLPAVSGFPAGTRHPATAAQGPTGPGAAGQGPAGQGPAGQGPAGQGPMQGNPGEGRL